MTISSTDSAANTKTAVSTSSHPPSVKQAPIPPADPSPSQSPVEQLLDRGLLVKVTQPDLNKRVARAWTVAKFDNPFIEQHEGRYFISLAPVKNPAKQRELYHLLHRFQIGAPIDVTTLPPQLRRIVQPQLIPRERFVGAFVLGLLPGLAIGILLMALAILINTLLQINNPAENFRIIAYTFAVAFALGWLLSTVIIWYELSHNITNRL